MSSWIRPVSDSFKPQKHVGARSSVPFAREDEVFTFEPSLEVHPVSRDAAVSFAASLRKRRPRDEQLTIADVEADRPVRIDREVLDFDHVVQQPVIAGPFEAVHDAAPAAAGSRQVEHLAFLVGRLQILPASLRG
jgi:hypothetical protein